MPRSSLSKAMIDAWLAGTARQSLSYLLSLAVIDSAVPFAEQVLSAFGFDSAKEPAPASASQDMDDPSGRAAAMTVSRHLIIVTPHPQHPCIHSPRLHVTTTSWREPY